MSIDLEPWPEWSERALQGLAFWIGHRHALFPDYPLPEAALVTEACNLIHANLDTNQRLLCEVQYTRLVPRGGWKNSHGSRSRADLVVIRKGRNSAWPSSASNLHTFAEVVIEVKRGTAPKAQIDNDLQRLAALKDENPNVRAMLFLVSESKRPKRFVSKEGRAILGECSVPNASANYRVRRACKAASAFSGKETAHYGCIIEVFSDKHP